MCDCSARRVAQSIYNKVRTHSDVLAQAFVALQPKVACSQLKILLCFNQKKGGQIPKKCYPMSYIKIEFKPLSAKIFASKTYLQKRVVIRHVGVG